MEHDWPRLFTVPYAGMIQVRFDGLDIASQPTSGAPQRLWVQANPHRWPRQGTCGEIIHPGKHPEDRGTIVFPTRLVTECSFNHVTAVLQAVALNGQGHHGKVSFSPRRPRSGISLNSGGSSTTLEGPSHLGPATGRKPDHDTSMTQVSQFLFGMIPEITNLGGGAGQEARTNRNWRYWRAASTSLALRQWRVSSGNAYQVIRLRQSLPQQTAAARLSGLRGLPAWKDQRIPAHDWRGPILEVIALDRRELAFGSWIPAGMDGMIPIEGHCRQRSSLAAIYEAI